MRKPFALASLAIALAFASDAVAQLSEPEQRIVASIRNHSDDAVKLLERAATINSGTLNLEGVRDVGRVFAQELESLGFEVRWIDMPPEMHRAGHLVATRKGSHGKRVLLMGHLDTVFEKDAPVPKWERQGDIVHGQGVDDMKGADVAVIEALRALNGVGALEGATITVFFTGDEERTGEPVSAARRDLVEAAKASDLALSFEGTVRRNGLPTATIARRAVSGWALSVSARQGHSAGVFGRESGYGAIYEAARILDAFREKLPEPDLTFNPGLILGGTHLDYDASAAKGTAGGKTNIIAPAALVYGDLRFLSAEQGARAKSRMQEIVASGNLSGTQAKIAFRDDFPPMPPTEGNLRLLEIYSKASVDAGLGNVEPLPPGERGGGDVQFIAAYLDCLDGLGTSGGGSHSPREFVELSSLEKSAIRAALMIYRLTRP
ncbi:MAG: M20/M25/M40 family metallo-hydrolase [Bacillota bacterium]